MPESPDPAEIEALWRQVLTVGHKHRLAVLPSNPRCEGCFVPFGGVGGIVARANGIRPSRKNPNFCNYCDDALPPGGAEIELAIVFADVRGSTAMGERLGPTAFAKALNRFYKAATDVIIAHNAVIDKMVGDEVMAVLYPLMSGPLYQREAVKLAADMLRSVGYGSASGPWVPVGVGLQCGVSFYGKVGTGTSADVTALGDTVNTAARLRDEAKAGEIVTSEEVYQHAADLFPNAEARTVSLKGKAEPLAVRVLRPAG